MNQPTLNAKGSQLSKLDSLMSMATRSAMRNNLQGWLSAIHGACIEIYPDIPNDDAVKLRKSISVCSKKLYEMGGNRSPQAFGEAYNAISETDTQIRKTIKLHKLLEMTKSEDAL